MDLLSVAIVTIIVCFALGIWPSWKDNLSGYWVLVGVFVVTLIYIIFHKIELVEIVRKPLLEHLQISGEAVQNVGSIYNSENMVVKNLTVTGVFNYLPKGSIMAWTGITAPTGWTLCDGTNGAPDLRGRFILGYGGGDPINGIGGARTHTLLVTEMPYHSHSVSTRFEVKGNDGGTSVQLAAPGKGNSPSVSYNSSVTGEGGNQPYNMMPPYYVLAFIMKL